jgi:hypothetical protein
MPRLSVDTAGLPNIGGGLGNADKDRSCDFLNSQKFILLSFYYFRRLKGVCQIFSAGLLAQKGKQTRNEISDLCRLMARASHGASYVDACVPPDSKLSDRQPYSRRWDVGRPKRATCGTSEDVTRRRLVWDARMGWKVSVGRLRSASGDEKNIGQTESGDTVTPRSRRGAD